MNSLALAKKKDTINNETDYEVNFMHSVLHGEVTNETVLSKAKVKELEQEFRQKFGNPYSDILRVRDGKILNEKLISDFQLRESYIQQNETSRAKRPKATSAAKDVILPDNRNPPPASKLRDSYRNLDWDEYLDLKDSHIEMRLGTIPPVEFFKRAPLADIWKSFAKPGTFVELRNPFIIDHAAYWIAKIVYFAGYRALVRFVTLKEDENSESTTSPNYLTWISFCSNVPKPLGYISSKASEKYMLEAGPIIAGMTAETLQSRLSQFYATNQNNTISANHRTTIMNKITDMRTIDHTLVVECIDLEVFSETRLAKITTVLGNRVHVLYFGDDGVLGSIFKDGFCLSFGSENIHPFGWSYSVGVKLNGNVNNLRCSPLPPSEFPSWPSDIISIEVGMRLETRHPFSTHRIVGAIVTKVLRYGYFEVETRDKRRTFRTTMLYHVNSPFIYPVGFGENHGVEVEYVETNNFKNDDRQKLRLDLLPPRPPHNFKVGMKIEACDIRDTRFILPATVKRVAGHMLYIHFDSWTQECENFSWIDCEFSDIYPCGYSEMVALDWQGAVDCSKVAI